MDLATAATILKVITAGHSAWAAYCAGGVDHKELKALRDVLSAAEGIKGRREPADGAVQYLALVLAAFGRAYARHWGGRRELTVGWLKRRLDRAEGDRFEELRYRLRMAALGTVRPGDRPDDDAAVAGLTVEPLASDAYKALWWAFSDPVMDDEGEEPPIAVTPDAKREFERFYQLAWWEGLESPGGAPVRAFIDAARKDGAAQIGRHLLADMANWDQRHVFGNRRRTAEQDDGAPFVALGEMYIEPRAKEITEKDDDDEPTPILGRLRGWLDDPNAPHVLAVRADFGRGKSLTARRLVNELAQEALLDATTPSPDLWRPIFVRCADDLNDGNQPLAAIVSNAIKRHAEGLGLDCGLDHPACALPPDTDGQRLLIVLDGLDEVVLGHAALEGLFKRLRQKAGPRRRILVMSRPGALPSLRGLDGARLLELRPFGDDQITRWLQAWSRLVEREAPITLDGIRARRLAELAATPVLLYMIARTWDESPGEQARTQAWLYETFMRQVARGKHAHDADHHRPVYDAAVALRDRLLSEKLLSSDADAEAEDGMLWLLARLAWRARQKAWAHRITTRMARYGHPRRDAEPLTRRDISEVLRQELDLAPDKAESIEIGVILTMQADPTLGRDHVHFGHKSFEEFLVARFWATRLLALARGPGHGWQDHVEPLLGARLLMPDDRAFDFLMEILDGRSDRACSPFGWGPDTRETVKAWAERCFNDESQSFPTRESRIADDQRAVLREAALAIGSRIALLDGTAGLRATGAAAMRSLLGWFWTARESPRIIACKAHLPEIHAGVNYREADFRQAHLDGAWFEGATLDRARFEGASLVGAIFADANLSRARVDGANLERANLERAYCAGARLPRAGLDGAVLTGANLIYANLHGASLRGADLSGSTLRRTHLAYADLRGAVLVGVEQGGGSSTAESWRLTGARYSASTTWPHGFDPQAHGAILVDEPSETN